MASTILGGVGIGLGLSCSTKLSKSVPSSRRCRLSVKMAVSIEKKKTFTLKKSEEAFNAAKDQYMNHIMNETGATILLRGSGSGNSKIQQGEEPLHLFLSSNNSKSLEDTKYLAEHLLDTISMECGASSDGFRVSSSKMYGAVPPPRQLLTGVTSTVTCLAPVGGRLTPVAIPLQQVALALRQTHTTINSVVPPTPSLLANTDFNNLSSSSSSETKKRTRKFQEFPSTVKPVANSHQEIMNAFKRNLCLGDSIMQTMPAPDKLVPSSMPPPPPKFTFSLSSPPPPPPPPKFSSSSPVNAMTPTSIAMSKLPLNHLKF
ncbi:hypothetical protein ACFE04_008208 [Oxalis oulophora]